jgi:Skp family chaperone for outer membrane proteins
MRPVRHLASIVLVLLALCATARAQALEERWRKLVEAQDNAGAIALVEPAARTGDPKARSCLATSYRLAQRFREAAPIFEALAREEYHDFPNDTTGWHLVRAGWCREALHEFAAAEALYSRACAEPNESGHLPKAREGLDRIRKESAASGPAADPRPEPAPPTAAAAALPAGAEVGVIDMAAVFAGWTRRAAFEELINSERLQLKEQVDAQRKVVARLEKEWDLIGRGTEAADRKRDELAAAKARLTELESRFEPELRERFAEYNAAMAKEMAAGIRRFGDENGLRLIVQKTVASAPKEATGSLGEAILYAREVRPVDVTRPVIEFLNRLRRD